MGEHLIRVWQTRDIKDIHRHLLIYGDLAGMCAACQTMNIPLDARSCPSCRTPFRYVAFRNIRQHYAKVKALLANNSDVLVIDYDDYHQAHGKDKAKELLS